MLFAASLSVSNIYLYTYIINKLLDFFCVGAMYSGEYDACDVTLSVYPHRASLKNMPGHGGNRTYDLWNTSPFDNLLCSRVNKGRRFDSHRGQAYFSSLPGVDIHSE